MRCRGTARLACASISLVHRTPALVVRRSRRTPSGPDRVPSPPFLTARADRPASEISLPELAKAAACSGHSDGVIRALADSRAPTRGSHCGSVKASPILLERRPTQRAQTLLSSQPTRRGSKSASSMPRAAARSCGSNSRNTPTKSSTAMWPMSAPERSMASAWTALTSPGGTSIQSEQALA
jgi:hypothetical protein